MQGTQDPALSKHGGSKQLWEDLGEDREMQEQSKKREQDDITAEFRGLRIKPDQQRELETCIPRDTNLEAWAYTSSCPDGTVKCKNQLIMFK